MGPISSKVRRFRRETLHERLKERLQPSENDRVLKNGLSSSKPNYFSHSGPQGAEGGHHEEVGLGVAELRLIAFSYEYILNLVCMKIVRHGYLFVMGGVTLYAEHNVL